ncbi:MAG TPA: hypothetical protein VK012_04460 [Gemmatimonadales bacterium]|nr:hypothetical protein [Gemmatimonadales bacterium]
MLHVMEPNFTSLRNGVRALLGLALVASTALGPLAPVVEAQAAVDPNVAPRAAQLEREGERQVATDMLGRYLAVAPDDGRAWIQLGRFYRLDARDWHLSGHTGDPDGRLYLDLAGVAFDQGIRLSADSSVVLRGMVEMDRGILIIEDSGWSVASARRHGMPVALPRIITELGVNLLGSCPAQGVLVTGSELESVAAWSALVRQDARDDLVIVRTDLYTRDPRYRRRIAEAMRVDPTLPVRAALEAAATSRPLCLTPGADTAAAAVASAAPLRLVRVLGPAGAPDHEPIALTEIILASRQGGSVWMREVMAIYAAAAAHNALLCESLGIISGHLPPGTCRR